MDQQQLPDSQTSTTDGTTTSCNHKNGNSKNLNRREDYHNLSHAYSTYLSHDTQEQIHWEDVCRSYRQYATFAMAQWANHQYRLHSLTEEQRRYLPNALKRETSEFQHRSKLYKDAAIRNQFCLDCILRHAGQANSQDFLAAVNNRSRQKNSGGQMAIEHSTDSQMSKVSSVLKSLARDWSAEGKAERDMAYGPILSLVQQYLPSVPTMHQQLKSQSNSSTRQSKTPKAGSPDTPRICVPGAGVGRLACELAAKGYAVQGNEFSLYMLLSSDFILNGGLATPEHPLQISPYLLESRNVHAHMDPVRPISIPDVDPFQMIMASQNDPQQQASQPGGMMSTDEDNSASMNDVVDAVLDAMPGMVDDNHDDDNENMIGDIPTSLEDAPSQQPNSNSDESAGQPAPDFSMAAGEFISIYGKPRERERWNAFVACFFLDTAPCIIDYIRVMHSCLVPGGFVFHFGPLLWHWSGPAMRPDDKSWNVYQGRYAYLDPKYMTSMDLSWEDVRAIFVNVGFEIIQEKVGVRALYTADQRSMMNMTYRCIQFVARKRGGPPLVPQKAAPDDLPPLPDTYSSFDNDKTAMV